MWLHVCALSLISCGYRGLDVKSLGVITEHLGVILAFVVLCCASICGSKILILHPIRHQHSQRRLTLDFERDSAQVKHRGDSVDRLLFLRLFLFIRVIAVGASSLIKTVFLFSIKVVVIS